MPAASDPSALRRLRDALGHVATGVVVATAVTPGGLRLGITMNSFASVSLEPPLVLFSIDRRARGLADWQRVPGYAINVLAAGQAPLSNRFARPSPDKWAGVAFRAGLHGAPLIDGACARFECTAHDRHDGGDHVIFVARIDRYWADPDARPLVFHRGRYAEVTSPLPGVPVPDAAGWPLPIHY